MISLALNVAAFLFLAYVGILAGIFILASTIMIFDRLFSRNKPPRTITEVSLDL